MSKITAMYIRLSMEDEDVSLNQKEESNSVSSQRELLESFIGNHSELKDTKVQEYCDDGFTGTKFERPGYMKLMEDVRADKISCIVVKDLSNRNIRFPLKEELKYFYDNFQISLLYCSIVLSDEKKPALLMLISAFFAHALRSV